MDYPCAKFGDFSFSRFGFIVLKNTHRDTAKRFTPVTVVGVGKYVEVSLLLMQYKYHWLVFHLTDFKLSYNSHDCQAQRGLLAQSVALRKTNCNNTFIRFFFASDKKLLKSNPCQVSAWESASILQ